MTRDPFLEKRILIKVKMTIIPLIEKIHYQNKTQKKIDMTWFPLLAKQSLINDHDILKFYFGEL